MRRTASLALIAALALGTLTGCFVLPQAPIAQPDKDEPAEEELTPGTTLGTTGDCWETNYADMAAWATWEGGGPVDCDEPHQSYTLFAGELEADVDEPFTDGEMSAELSAATVEQCREEMLEFGVPAGAQRASFYFFVATEDDWEDGEHSIRCDIAVSEIDSEYAEPDLENLPDDIADLVDDIEENPISYELCVIGDSYGPFESNEAYLADCDGDDYYWRFAGSADYTDDLSAPYPSDEQLFAYADTACADFGARGDETLLPYVPSQEMWDYGQRFVSCWYSLVEAPSNPV